MSRNLLTLRDVVRRGSLSVEAVAALVGCRGRTVEAWLSGETKPSPIAQKALDRAIRQVEEALRGTGPEK